jgi:hypothetical protein
MMGDMGINQFITFNYYFLDQEVSEGVVFKKRSHRKYQRSDGPFKSKRIRNTPQPSKEKGIIPENLKLQNESLPSKMGKSKDKKNRLYDTLIKKK